MKRSIGVERIRTSGVLISRPPHHGHQRSNFDKLSLNRTHITVSENNPCTVSCDPNADVTGQHAGMVECQRSRSCKSLSWVQSRWHFFRSDTFQTIKVSHVVHYGDGLSFSQCIAKMLIQINVSMFLRHVIQDTRMNGFIVLPMWLKSTQAQSHQMDPDSPIICLD